MGKYNKIYLKDAERRKERIGGWKGYGVYACSARNYDSNSEDYWVIYDDGNAFVHKGMKYGKLTEDGNVENCKAQPYNVVKPAVSQVPQITMVTSASGEYSEVVSTDEFFAKLDADINKLLAEVNKWEPEKMEVEL